MIEKLNSVLQDLQKHKRDKNTVFAECVQKRLEDSVEVYYKEIRQSLSRVYKKDELRLLKKLTKE